MHSLEGISTRESVEGCGWGVRSLPPPHHTFEQQGGAVNIQILQCEVFNSKAISCDLKKGDRENAPGEICAGEAAATLIPIGQ